MIVFTCMHSGQERTGSQGHEIYKIVLGAAGLYEWVAIKVHDLKSVWRHELAMGGWVDLGH
jgi:hypothetical protein